LLEALEWNGSLEKTGNVYV